VCERGNKRTADESERARVCERVNESDREREIEREIGYVRMRRCMCVCAFVRLCVWVGMV